MPEVRRRNPDLYPDPVAVPRSGSAMLGQFMMPPRRNPRPPQRCLPGRAHYPSVQRLPQASPAPAAISSFRHPPLQPRPTRAHRLPQHLRLHTETSQNVLARAAAPAPTPKQNPLKIRHHPAAYFTARFHHFRGDRLCPAFSALARRETDETFFSDSFCQKTSPYLSTTCRFRPASRARSRAPLEVRRALMLPDRHLTQAQQRVVALMSASFTATAAARSVAVHRKTAGHWFRSSALREALMQAVVTRTSPVESKPGRSLPL